MSHQIVTSSSYISLWIRSRLYSNKAINLKIIYKHIYILSHCGSGRGSAAARVIMIKQRSGMALCKNKDKDRQVENQTKE